MAEDTSVSLRGSLLYSVYVRAYGPGGAFADVERDVKRIRDLGTDIVWLMPVQPIGGEARKGALGSPYAIRDYRAVNPELGRKADFVRLVEAIHAAGMRCILDCVYNHTSRDSVLLREHPEYFYRGPDGEPGNRAGAWEDVFDLDYTQEGLWDEQIESLCHWARLGIDGFRCDVASLVPIGFWKRTRRAVRAIRPDAVFLAESVHPDFVVYLRSKGFPCLSDGELYEAFDITYDYDVRTAFEDALSGKGSVRAYIEALARQEAVYPANFLKLRFLENHDQPRAAALIPDRERLLVWTAMTFFMKGVTMLYNGQEAFDAHTPSLFERDPVDWSGMEEGFTALLQKLAAIRKDPLVTEGSYAIAPAGERGDAAFLSYTGDGEKLCGLFNLGGGRGLIDVALPDGVYRDLLEGGEVVVCSGKMALTPKAQIFRAPLES